MSEALTPDAPETDVAAPSVEDSVPTDETAVASGSAGDRVVPVERFNGLMSSFNKLQAEREADRARLAALEAQLSKQETPVVTEDNGTVEEVRALREELRQERLNTARSRILEQYPQAKPFADLIVGNSEAELEAVASAIHARMEGVLANTSPASAEDPAAADPALAVEPAPAAQDAPVVVPGAPVVTGGTTAPTDASVNERVASAIRSGDFNAYLEAKAAGIAADLA